MIITPYYSTKVARIVDTISAQGPNIDYAIDRG